MQSMAAHCMTLLAEKTETHVSKSLHCLVPCRRQLRADWAIAAAGGHHRLPATGSGRNCLWSPAPAGQRPLVMRFLPCSQNSSLLRMVVLPPTTRQSPGPARWQPLDSVHAATVLLVSLRVLLTSMSGCCWFCLSTCQPANILK